MAKLSNRLPSTGGSDERSEFRALNRITLDDLGVAITGAGLRVARIKLITNDCMITAAAAGVPLSHLTIGGVQLLAVPA